MPKIACIIPYSRKGWRKTQEAAFFSHTFEPLGLVEPPGITCSYSINLLTCGIPRVPRLSDGEVRVHSVGFNNEAKAIRLFLDSKQAKEADYFMYVWLGARPVNDILPLLLPELETKTFAYGRMLAYTDEYSHGKPLVDENIYEPADPSTGFEHRFCTRCPVPPVFLCRREFLESIDPELPGSYILDAALKAQDSVCIDNVTGTSKYRLLDFGHPMSGDEGVRLSTRWGVLSPKSEF